MLVLQRPDVTIVGGLQQWRKLGRHVKKGEKGCYMWVPLGTRETDEQGMMHTDMPDEKRFKLVAVFDVSQTEEISKEEAA
jgi:antirestriction protein ArdC